MTPEVVEDARRHAASLLVGGGVKLPVAVEHTGARPPLEVIEGQRSWLLMLGAWLAAQLPEEGER